MDQNQKLSLKFLGLIGLGGAVILPVVGFWLYELNNLSFLAGSSKYAANVPPTPAVKVKEVAPYCVPGVQKRSLGCN